MCRRHLFCVLFILTLGSAGAALAQDWDIEIPSTSTPPVIDGQIDSVWSIAPYQYLGPVINGSAPGSPADASAKWKVMWDADFLYAIVDVNDDNLVNDTGTTWQDDSVEFYIDGDNSKDGSPLADDNRQYTFGWTTDDIQGTNQDDTAVEHAQVDTETGWRIEMKFPWSTLTGVPRGMGDLIGIDCFYNDDDDGSDTRETQISTFADDGGDWENPADWGTALLVKGSAEKASGPVPPDGATDVLRDVVLEWTPGQFASTHDVYFGDVFDDVNDATRDNPLNVLVSQDQTVATYQPPEALDFGQTYYWRIDEVNGAPDFSIFKGHVWSFTVEPFAYPIEGIIATSNLISISGQEPENVVNGSGLDSDDQHSTKTSDMWGGTPPADEPGQITFEFNRLYKLHEMYVWNHNFDFELFMGMGIKDVTIEYSADGVEWTTLDDVTLAQAPGLGTYTYNSLIEFGGVAAKYVRLIIVSSYGVSGTMGLSEVRFMCLPVHAREPEPEEGAVDVPLDTLLSWRPGREAVSHEVYLGTDPNTLSLAGTTTPSRYAPALNLDTTYFWQVIEVNDAEAVSAWAGDIWSFSTQEYVVIDDFESYVDDESQGGQAIWSAWIDGLVAFGGDPDHGGSQVGHDTSPFAEQTIVRTGSQSMPLYFSNTNASALSEADRNFATARDWTLNGVKSLSLWFYGAIENTGQLYIKIDGTQVLYDGDASDIAGTLWHPWNIDLSTVGANLSNVTTLTIGVQGIGSGVVYIDDIRLYGEAAEKITPVDPEPTGLAAHYTFDEGAGTTVGDSSGNGNTGTVVGNPLWASGVLNGAMEFSGDDYVDCGDDASLQIRDAITVACWIKVASFSVEWETIVAMGDDSYRIGRGPANGDSMHFGCNGTSAGNFNGVAVVTTDTWRHVAGVYDGQNMCIYVDGMEDNRIPSTGQIDVSAHPLYIAENAQQTGRQLGGSIDDVRIYSRALSPAEVAGLAGRTALLHVPF